MCGEQGFIAVHEMVHLVKFMLMLHITGYKVLKYLSWIRMVFLAAQQQNKLIQFPVCAYVGVLFTLDIL